MSATEITEQPQQRHRSVSHNGGWWGAVVATLVVGALGGFLIGLQVGKGSSVATMAGVAGNGQARGGFGMRGGTFGTVTAVTSDSITVKDTRRSTTVTYAITSSTTVTDNGATAALSDVVVGDSVIVQSSSTDTTTDDSTTTKTATTIALNPSMPSAPGDSSATQ